LCVNAPQFSQAPFLYFTATEVYRQRNITSLISRYNYQLHINSNPSSATPHMINSTWYSWQLLSQEMSCFYELWKFVTVLAKV